MIVVLLAAGFATRLYPLTLDRAKPLLDVGGEAVLTRLLHNALRVPGVTEVRVVTNAKFHAQFAEWRAGLDVPVPLRLIDDGARSQDEMRGGVCDLLLALETPQREPGSSWLVVAGDNLLEFELSTYAACFRERGVPLVLARSLTPPVPPRRYGEILTDENGAIVRFREKPERPESTLAATCIYFLPPGIEADVARYLDEGGDRDAPGHFVGWLSARRRVEAVPFEGIAHDIGDRDSLERARRLYSSGDA